MHDSKPATTATDDALTTYVSALGERFASRQMQRLWSPATKFGLWRRLWLALAEAEQELGLPITDEQISALRAHLEVTGEDLERAAAHERELRHDVMAHVHALGDAAPVAKPIIHLGATSQFVNCNAEIIQLRDSLSLVCVKLARCIDALSDFAHTWRDMPTLAFTHFQPAQPTTVGKRASVWAYDLVLCLERLEAMRDGLRLRGVKGATGTQASFLSLFDGDALKVEALDRAVCERLGWDPDQRLAVTGQTYPRVIDAFVLGDLAATAASVHKICTDIRLLAHRKEVDEPMASAQIGSSAMPYKRNPMRCERACGLARFVMSLAANALHTASSQWLERTLDDSSNRRLTLPEAFLALDGALDLMHNVASGLEVHTAVVRASVMAELPFMVTENLMMEAVRLGLDRQDVHEAIRRHSRAAAAVVKDEGKPNDLLARLANEPLLAGVDVEGALDPMQYVGLAPRQVDRFVAEVATGVRRRYSDDLAESPEPHV
jgi:adenylosuccinate lyase